MANVRVVPQYMILLGRSTFLNSKILLHQRSFEKSISSASIAFRHISSTKMSSTTTTTTSIKNSLEEIDKVEPEILEVSSHNKGQSSVIVGRPSMIKSSVTVESPSNDMASDPTTIQRPSVICSVKKSVVINNTSGTPTPVLVVGDDSTRDTVINQEVAPSTKVADGVISSTCNLEIKTETPKNSDPVVTVNPVNDSSDPNDEASKRIKKRKVVLMLSYSGTGYFGMQRNPDTKTIEDDLFQSLLKNNYIDEESYNRPQLINFQRAARTDKNVSAARQIVSIKLPENVSIEQINQYLPPQIRVQGLKRVTKGFDAKNNCNARTYSYMLPTFAFVPIDGVITESFRITPEILENIREKLKAYIGRKNYHNFTSRKKPNDPSAQRVIISFDCSDPFIQEGLEYVILRVKGQSFMMHQIRKMIGLLIAMVRGFASYEVMEKAFTTQRIDIPRAPGLGLMLDKVHYEHYDKKFAHDGLHEGLTWDSVDSTINEFCKQYIYSTVTKLENEEKSMFKWLETLIYHTYEFREHEPLVSNEDDDKVTNKSQSVIGKAFFAVAKARGTLDEDEDEDGGDDDDDDEIPKAKKLKQMT